MRLPFICSAFGAFVSLSSATILQNGQVRITNYPNTVFNGSTAQFSTYPPHATELSYKGRWDSKFISWWSAPGLKFGFTGQEVAITFGPYTTDTVLVGYRIDGQDWQLTNITTNATHLLVDSTTVGVNLTSPVNPSTFEMRVTNWASGVQIASIHVGKGEKLVKVPDFGRTIEVIGDSLSSGYSATLEGLSSYAYGLTAGLGNTEYSLTAYPGVCLFDKQCYGNLRGMFYQWFQTSDTSGRAIDIWGDNPEVWNFSNQPAADIVIINLGTNDNNHVNNVSTTGYVAQYTMLIEGVHAIWPKAQIILIALWEGFDTVGNTYIQSTLDSDVGFVPQIYSIYEYFNSKEYLQNPVLYDPVKNSTYQSQTPSDPFVHYFNTTGILQHNDIGPQYHPTDAGHIKLASHLMQYIKMKFDWPLYATGPEVFHDTLYWNDQTSY
ncbi:GDSL-like Lipase/Acylhydrolase-like protein [Mollisia scopiformis]|uniref:GDSL-like Lipase/Acylhydrolase-like protein n=1 Tax=Mollisia scopiformis TaxID=149040 RepID=A0A194XTI4_MOLSC|nr:GDSL-like Lipase/Acylhydrolase-like protein [Mollisia scopiformis]KUJ23359.1 GDSL-like Lipase/Acylhydrolase-like protein [Mollisia scopiformis]